MIYIWTYDLLRADREGIWELHLDAIQRALYMFAAFNSTNYLRWCSLYLEDMRGLSVTAPSVYKQFSNGNFSIKDKPGRFTAVGGDQKLEQTVNLSPKHSDAVIGHAKQKTFVAQWDLIHHEMQGVMLLHRQYTNTLERSDETFVHHESSQSTTDRKESHIQNMIQYIDAKGSPFAADAPTNLQNIVTKEIMSEKVRHDILMASTKGKEKYIAYRKCVFVEKSQRISSTINRLNLNTMANNTSKPEKTTKARVKEINIMD